MGDEWTTVKWTSTASCPAFCDRDKYFHLAYADFLRRSLTTANVGENKKIRRRKFANRCLLDGNPCRRVPGIGVSRSRILKLTALNLRIALFRESRRGRSTLIGEKNVLRMSSAAKVVANVPVRVPVVPYHQRIRRRISRSSRVPPAHRPSALFDTLAPPLILFLALLGPFLLFREPYLGYSSSHVGFYYHA